MKWTLTKQRKIKARRLKSPDYIIQKNKKDTQNGKKAERKGKWWKWFTVTWPETADTQEIQRKKGIQKHIEQGSKQIREKIGTELSNGELGNDIFSREWD